MKMCASIRKAFDNIDCEYGLEYDATTHDDGFSWDVYPWRDDSIAEVENLCCVADEDAEEDWEFNFHNNAIEYYNAANVLVGIIRVRPY